MEIFTDLTVFENLGGAYKGNFMKIWRGAFKGNFWDFFENLRGELIKGIFTENLR